MDFKVSYPKVWSTEYRLNDARCVLGGEGGGGTSLLLFHCRRAGKQQFFAYCKAMTKENSEGTEGKIKKGESNFSDYQPGMHTKLSV